MGSPIGEKRLLIDRPVLISGVPISVSLAINDVPNKKHFGRRL
jgi:hypothetical protein